MDLFLLSSEKLSFSGNYEHFFYRSACILTEKDKQIKFTLLLQEIQGEVGK